jgi:demethylmenaquinone methyltransferase/2-methoxy-6-polyprenyl-1,4-benzoquinol methylase
MVDKQRVAVFFDELADKWDSNETKKDDIINKILDNAEVSCKNRILDVACGTGILIPYYINRDVSLITAIDISSKMISIAKSKFKDNNVEFICADAEEYAFGGKYNNIVIYNAFPHFSSPEKLIANLSSCLIEGGTLTIAHSASREKINHHHDGLDETLFSELMPAEELADLFSKYLQPVVSISDESMYQVVGKRNNI